MTRLRLSPDEIAFRDTKRLAGVPDSAIARMMGRTVLELRNAVEARYVAVVYDLDRERRRQERLALEHRQRKSNVWRATGN
jgi:selenocysteine-specific translation elongation factor